MATATEQLRAEVARAKSYGGIRLRLDIEVPIALLDEALAEMDLEREKYARALATKDEGLDALRAERDALRGDAEAYANALAYLSDVGAKGHDVDGDAREGIGSLVEQRDAERARAESAERELAAVLGNLDVASINKALDEVRAERDALRASFVKAAQVANEVTQETQTPEEMAVALVRLVFEARGLREAERARADRALKVLRDLAAAYDVTGTAHGVSYLSTSDGAGSAWRAVAELLASEDAR